MIPNRIREDKCILWIEKKHNTKVSGVCKDLTAGNDKHTRRRMA